MEGRIHPRFERIYRKVNRQTGRVPEVIFQAIHHFNRVRGAEAAASVAYYAIFSLFPLLLFLTSILGFMIVNAKDPSAIIAYILQALPISRTFIQENLIAIMSKRSTSGIVGVVGLIWAASGVFLSIARNINRAWPGAASRNFIQGRLVALIMIIILTFLLVTGFSAVTVASLSTALFTPVPSGAFADSNSMWYWLTHLFSWGVAFLIFFSLYRWVPNTRVRKREAFWGAVLATISWETLTWLFSLYLSNPLVGYERIYGSLGAALALMTWIYLSAIIILFGAHVSASVARLARHPETNLQKQEGEP